MNDRPSNQRDDFDENSADTTDPSVNDVLAQQMGADYDQVEAKDKEDLQKKLKDQGTKSEDFEKDIPSEGAVDDRDTSDGQLISS